MTILKRLFIPILNKDIRKFSGNEEDTFYAHVDGSGVNVSSFEYNWAYILQATRKHGLVLEGKHSVIYFWIRNRHQLVVVNRLGPHTEELLRRLLEIGARWKLQVVIKNVLPAEVLSLARVGFRLRAEPWSAYSMRDDNTYPQTVADMQANIELKRHGIKSTSRTIIRKFLRTRNIEAVPYEKKYETEARKLLHINSQYLEEKGVENSKEVHDAHVFFFDETIKEKVRLAYVEDGRLIGVGFFTARRDVVYWNALINRNEPKLMLFLIWKSLWFIEQKHPGVFRRVTLQGSEVLGQHRWKQGFYPTETIEKVHVESLPFSKSAQG